MSGSATLLRRMDVICCFSLILATAEVVGYEILIVDLTGKVPNSYSSFGSAVIAARDGDIVEVLASSYYPCMNTTVSQRNLTIQSTTGAVFDCHQESSPALWVTNAVQSFTLKGLEFQNSLTGVVVFESAEGEIGIGSPPKVFRIERCSFSKNSVESAIGAALSFRIRGSSRIDVVESNFVNNSNINPVTLQPGPGFSVSSMAAGVGGAVGIFCMNSCSGVSVNLQSCRFSENQLKSNSGGGAVGIFLSSGPFVSNNSISVQECSFHKNFMASSYYQQGASGAFGIIYDGSGNVTMTRAGTVSNNMHIFANSSFRGNYFQDQPSSQSYTTTSYSAGGVSVLYRNSGEARSGGLVLGNSHHFVNCTFIDNISNGTGASGSNNGGGGIGVSFFNVASEVASSFSDGGFVSNNNYLIQGCTFLRNLLTSSFSISSGSWGGGGAGFYYNNFGGIAASGNGDGGWTFQDVFQIIGSTFVNNSLTSNGGGIGGGGLAISYTNSANDGGIGSGGSILMTTYIIHNCTFSSNAINSKQSQGGGGVGIVFQNYGSTASLGGMIEQNSISLTSSSFENNSVVSFFETSVAGGGFGAAAFNYASGGNGGPIIGNTFTVNGCTFSSNFVNNIFTSTSGAVAGGLAFCYSNIGQTVGGAIWNNTHTVSETSFSDNSVINSFLVANMNTASSNSAGGLGIYHVNAGGFGAEGNGGPIIGNTNVVSACSFTNNTVASIGGSGLYGGGGGLSIVYTNYGGISGSDGNGGDIGHNVHIVQGCIFRGNNLIRAITTGSISSLGGAFAIVYANFGGGFGTFGNVGVGGPIYGNVHLVQDCTLVNNNISRFYGFEQTGGGQSSGTGAPGASTGESSITSIDANSGSGGIGISYLNFGSNNIDTGGSAENNSHIFQRCIILQNFGSDVQVGGIGILVIEPQIVKNNSAIFADVVAVGNLGRDSGGLVFFSQYTSSSASKIHMQNVTASQNIAGLQSSNVGAQGGGVTVVNGQVFADRLDIQNNSLTLIGIGGGMYLGRNSSLFLQNSIIQNNDALLGSELGAIISGSIAITSTRINCRKNSDPLYVVADGGIQISSSTTSRCPPGQAMIIPVFSSANAFSPSNLGEVTSSSDTSPQVAAPSRVELRCDACVGSSYDLTGGFLQGWIGPQQAVCLPCPFGGICMDSTSVKASPGFWGLLYVSETSSQSGGQVLAAFTACPFDYCRGAEEEDENEDTSSFGNTIENDNIGALLIERGKLNDYNDDGDAGGDGMASSGLDRLLQKASIASGLNGCAPGRNSSIPLCGGCLDGYTQALFSVHCIETSRHCSSSAWIWIFGLLYVGGIVAWYLFAPVGSGWMLLLLFFFYQIVITVLPPSTTWTSLIMSLFSLEFGRVGGAMLSGVCAVPALTTTGSFSLPLLSVLGEILGLGIFACISAWKPRLFAPSRFRIGAAAARVALFAYSSLVGTSARLLHCVEINGSGGVRVLYDAGETQCSQHWQIATIIGLIFFIGPSPVVLALIVRGKWRWERANSGSESMWRGASFSSPTTSTSTSATSIAMQSAPTTSSAELMGEAQQERQEAGHTRAEDAHVSDSFSSPFTHLHAIPSSSSSPSDWSMFVSGISKRDDRNSIFMGFVAVTVSPFKPRWWYWNSIILLQRLVLGLIFALVTDSAMRVLLLGISLAIFLYIHIVARPFASKAANNAAGLLYVNLIVMAMLTVRTNAFLVGDVDIQLVQQTAISDGLAVFSTLLLIWPAALLVAFHCVQRLLKWLRANKMKRRNQEGEVPLLSVHS